MNLQLLVFGHWTAKLAAGKEFKQVACNPLGESSGDVRGGSPRVADALAAVHAHGHVAVVAPASHADAVWQLHPTERPSDFFD